MKMAITMPSCNIDGIMPTKTNPLYTRTRPRRLVQNTNASSSPRMICSLLPHSRPCVPLTPDPLITLKMKILMPSLVSRFGINKFHSTKYRSNPTAATIPNISDCCTVCFNWCIRQNTQSLQITLSIVVLY